jgi:cystathionine beta-synthase
MSKVYNDEWMAAQGFFDTKNEVDAQRIELVK